MNSIEFDLADVQLDLYVYDKVLAVSSENLLTVSLKASKSPGVSK